MCAAEELLKTHTVGLKEEGLHRKGLSKERCEELVENMACRVCRERVLTFLLKLGGIR